MSEQKKEQDQQEQEQEQDQQEQDQQEQDQQEQEQEQEQEKEMSDKERIERIEKIKEHVDKEIELLNWYYHDDGVKFLERLDGMKGKGIIIPQRKRTVKGIKDEIDKNLNLLNSNTTTIDEKKELEKINFRNSTGKGEIYPFLSNINIKHDTFPKIIAGEIKITDDIKVQVDGRHTEQVAKITPENNETDGGRRRRRRKSRKSRRKSRKTKRKRRKSRKTKKRRRRRR
tara:strand:- start:10 stop:693 length:684 start_codon:yes stop_codon:yes gene_type:complete